jgi:predicted alpha/beta hydrolase family esterase
MRKTRFIIIHGAYGNPEENWFPWLSAELEKKSHECLLPQFPTPEGQSLATWMTAFTEQIGEIRRDDVLVAHSLGPAFVMNLVATHGTPIHAAIFVAPFVGNLDNPAFDTINDSFVNAAFDWARLKSLLPQTFIFASDNDPYVPLRKGKELARKLEAELTIVPNAGHFNAAAGYSTFPLLLSCVQDLLAKQKI